MKYYFIVIVIILSSCKKEKDTTFDSNQQTKKTAISGEVLFTENNCAACHKEEQKVVGPSLQEMAKIYKEQKGDMVAFLKEEAEPIIDPKMYETMRINLQVTKTKSDEELKALESYILGFAK